MQLARFESMVRRMADHIPEEYLDGVAAIEVSRDVVRHPEHPAIYTLGECVPLETGSDEVASRIVLYYGSFAALAAERGDFDWREEAWETLLHELRHHVEWRARTDRLGEYDWAADQNFARLEGRTFDPLFYRGGEPAGPGAYRVDDDLFVERVVRDRPEMLALDWEGRRYRVPVPEAPLPLYLRLVGFAEEPPGEIILVVRRKSRLRDLFRRPPKVTERRVRVAPA